VTADWRGLAVPFGVLLLWEIAGQTLFIPGDTTSRPSNIVAAASALLVDGSIAGATFETLAAAGSGFAIAAALGITLGIVLGLSTMLRGVTWPALELLRPIPAVALIPLGLLVFGFGARMEVMIVAFACLWPVLVVTIAAVRGVEPRLIEVGRGMKLSPLALIAKIVLPVVIARLFVGLRLAAGVALVVAVTVEIAANPQGLGYGLVMAQQNLQPQIAFALLLWIGTLGSLLNWSLGYVERRVFGRFLQATYAAR
jgi:NitT/TauT family transport system permease protein